MADLFRLLSQKHRFWHFSFFHFYIDGAASGHHKKRKEGGLHGPNMDIFSFPHANDQLAVRTDGQLSTNGSAKECSQTHDRPWGQRIAVKVFVFPALCPGDLWEYSGRRQEMGQIHTKADECRIGAALNERFPGKPAPCEDPTRQLTLPGGPKY